MKPAILILLFGVLVAGFIVFSSRSPDSSTNGTSNQDANNVSIVNGKQIVEITARGGYSPEISTAKAGIPTIIRFKTKGSFDCSSSVRIPSLNFSKLLPQSGNTDVDAGTPAPGTLLGSCGMGMYRFQINFTS
jgi:plastocyanin domain-containing protein